MLRSQDYHCSMIPMLQFRLMKKRLEEETEEEIEIPEDILLSLRIDGLLEINSMQASSILSDFKNTLESNGNIQAVYLSVTTSGSKTIFNMILVI